MLLLRIERNKRSANHAVLVTAARLGFLLNAKGHSVGGGPRRRALGQCDFDSIKFNLKLWKNNKAEQR